MEPTSSRPAHDHRHGHGQDHDHGHAQDHSRDHDRGHSPGDAPDGGLAEILDLDAGLFAAYLTTVTEELARLLGPGVGRIVDVGAGTGSGTFALLERFPHAEVTALDASPEMLALIGESARAKGLQDRVHLLEADAVDGLHGLSDVDLVWASASLHHVEDPAAALAGIRTALRPGGRVALAELDGMPFFLPDGEEAALETRCRRALDVLRAEQMPQPGADFGQLLTQAGFVVELERTQALELRAPLPPAARRYAFLALSRIRDALEDRISPADAAALAAVVDGGPRDVRQREDLVIRSTRQLWVAISGSKLSL